MWLRPLSAVWKELPKSDMTGLFLWLTVPLAGFSLVSTKLIWYVYPSTVPLCLLAAVFLEKLLKYKRLPAGCAALVLAAALAGSGHFLWNNYLDNVRGARGNDLQTFISESFSRDGAYAGAAIYLDAYDPFLYGNTKEWEQNNRLLAMLSGDLDCRDGGAEGFLRDQSECLLILSIPFLEDYPKLKDFPVLADNGQYLLIKKTES